MPSVVRIGILSDDEFPWHTQKGYAGWVGTAEAKRKVPLLVISIGFLFILVGAHALTNGRKYRREGLNAAQPEVSVK
jgi:hypothetical protein